MSKKVQNLQNLECKKSKKLKKKNNNVGVFSYSKEIVDSRIKEPSKVCNTA